MAQFVETKIGEGFYSRLRSMPNVLPIAWENRPFSRPASGGYLEARLFPNRTTINTIGQTGLNLHAGFFQINVNWPGGKTISPPCEEAGRVIDYFRLGTTIIREGVTIKVYQPPYASAALLDEGWLTIPVTIPYQTRVPRD